MNVDDEQPECPLCMEPFEIDDTHFFPCQCGYKICRFCWHRIRTDENGLCPACRQPYSEDPAKFKPLTEEEIKTITKERRSQETQRKQKAVDTRKHLANIRVLQRNLVFVVGLSPRLCDGEVLKRQEYFGRYGKIYKIAINSHTSYNTSQGPSLSAYVTYSRPEEALRCIMGANEAKIDQRTLKVSLGTTKYCSHFLKGTQCMKQDCMYLHEQGDEVASFTKEDMQAGKHTLYERKLFEDFQMACAANGEYFTLPWNASSDETHNDRRKETPSPNIAGQNKTGSTADSRLRSHSQDDSRRNQSQPSSSQPPSSQLPSSQLPSSQLPSSQLPSSQLPSLQLPSSQPLSSQPSSQPPSSQPSSQPASQPPSQSLRTDKRADSSGPASSAPAAIANGHQSLTGPDRNGSRTEKTRHPSNGAAAAGAQQTAAKTTAKRHDSGGQQRRDFQQHSCQPVLANSCNEQQTLDQVDLSLYRTTSTGPTSGMPPSDSLFSSAGFTVPQQQPQHNMRTTLVTSSSSNLPTTDGRKPVTPPSADIQPQNTQINWEQSFGFSTSPSSNKTFVPTQMSAQAPPPLVIPSMSLTSGQSHSLPSTFREPDSSSIEDGLDFDPCAVSLSGMMEDLKMCSSASAPPTAAGNNAGSNNGSSNGIGGLDLNAMMASNGAVPTRSISNGSTQPVLENALQRRPLTSDRFEQLLRANAEPTGLQELMGSAGCAGNVPFGAGLHRSRFFGGGGGGSVVPMEGLAPISGNVDLLKSYQTPQQHQQGPAAGAAQSNQQLPDLMQQLRSAGYSKSSNVGSMGSTYPVSTMNAYQMAAASSLSGPVAPTQLSLSSCSGRLSQTANDFGGLASSNCEMAAVAVSSPSGLEALLDGSPLGTYQSRFQLAGQRPATLNGGSPVGTGGTGAQMVGGAAEIQRVRAEIQRQLFGSGPGLTGQLTVTSPNNVQASMRNATGMLGYGGVQAAGPAQSAGSASPFHSMAETDVTGTSVWAHSEQGQQQAACSNSILIGSFGGGGVGGSAAGSQGTVFPGAPQDSQYQYGGESRPTASAASPNGLWAQALNEPNKRSTPSLSPFDSLCMAAGVDASMHSQHPKPSGSGWLMAGAATATGLPASDWPGQADANMDVPLHS